MTLRMSEMSISMWLKAGVPSVRTMCSHSAASSMRSVSRSRPPASTLSSSSCVPGSWNGMRPLAIDSSTAGTLSTPTTSRPRLANESASGRPIRPRPTTATFPVGMPVPYDRAVYSGTMRTLGSGTMKRPPRSRNSVSRSRNSSRKCHGSAR